MSWREKKTMEITVRETAVIENAVELVVVVNDKEEAVLVANRRLNKNNHGADPNDSFISYQQ